MKRITARPRQSDAGFTIVELMIATVVFSTVLVVITSGVIHFTSTYYKGVNSSSTQAAARDVINTISQDLQYAGGADSFIGNGLTVAGGQYVCIGQIQIDFNLGAQLGSGGDYGVFITSVPSTGCGAYTPDLAGKELLSPKMRLTDLSITKSTGSVRNLYTISAGVAYGDPDLLCSRTAPADSKGACSESAPALDGSFDWVNQGSTVTCKSGTGSQFCAYSRLSTQVVARFEPVN